MPRHGRRSGWLICLLMVASAAVAQDSIPGSRDSAFDSTPRQPTPWEDDVQFHDIQFITSRLGWAVGDQGGLWRSTDGGDTWEPITTNIPCPLRSICFLTDRIGWVAGGGIHPYTHVAYGVLLATEDGGQTWQNLAMLPVSSGTPPINRRSALNVSESNSRSKPDPEMDAEIAKLEKAHREKAGHREEGANPGQEPVRTRTARPKPNQPVAEKPFLPSLTSVKFFDRKHGIVCGTPTAECPSGVLRTNDGGKTFQSLPGPISGRWLAASFSQPDRGVLVGMRGMSALVSEARLQPTQLNNLDPRGLYSVKLQMSGPAWLVGDGGLVLQSANQGLIWQASPGDMPEGVNRLFDFRAVAARGNHVWVAGEPGSVVWHSADAGHSWTRGLTRQTLPIRALSFISDTHGWAAGALGTILRTEDGGQTWRSCRARQRRLALLSMTAHSRQTPLGLMTHVSGELGYRMAVLHVARDDAGPGATPDQGRQEMLDLAVTFAGANTSRTSWQFPLSVPGLDRDSNLLLADWKRRTEGQLTKTLIGHLVAQLRMWRPSVLLLEEPTAGDALTRTIQQAALHAVEQAADPSLFPEHDQTGGLAAWQVLKIFTRLPSGSNGPVRLDPYQFLPRLGGTVQVVSAPSRGLLLESRLTPTSETYRLKKSNLQNLREDLAGVDFFSGLGLSPGTPARRDMPAISEDDLEQQRKLAERQRNVNAFLVRSLNDDRLSNQMIAQLGNVIRDMPPAQAALQLQQTAEAYLSSGRCGLAEQTFSELADRYPDEPAAAHAMVWLVQYWGSQETTWQKVRREKIGKLESTPNVEAAERRLARANSRIRRQVAEAEQRQNLLPISGNDPQASPDGPEIIPVEFREKRDNGHLDPQEQFQDWQRRSRQMSERLASRIPGIYREPQVQFPLASLARKMGNPLRSDEIFRRFMPSDGIEAPGLVPREIWLTNPVSPLPQSPALCATTADRPQLDGVLSESCWQRAAELVLSSSPVAGTPGDKHAFVMVCHDDKHLYLGGTFPRSPSSRTDGPIRRARQYDEDLQNFDRLQILLDVDRDYFTWYDFQVDQRGCTSEACWRDRTWNPKWYVATQSDEQSWRVEIAIPFSELVWKSPGAAKPGAAAPAMTWGLSLMRTIPAVGIETWIHGAPATPRPESFGLLRFE